MKSLGYPGDGLSMESFRTPHFDTVASCIRWLLPRYDPEVQLHGDVSTEEGRIAFLKSAGRVMFLKTRMKLNLRSLYMADSNATAELLQVSTLLQQAIASASSEKLPETTLFKRAFDVKAARSLVLEIIKAGATLYDDLATEMQLQGERNMAASTNTDIEQIENLVREGTFSLLQTVSSVEQQQHSCEKDEKSLSITHEKRKVELERCKKRLSVLENVRPAYLDEYEVLQSELQRLFGVYLEKFHNLRWLESQLETHNQEEQEKLQESFAMMKRLQQQLQDENLQILRGEESGNNKDNVELSELSWSDSKLSFALLAETGNTVANPQENSFNFNQARHSPSKDVSEAISDDESDNGNEQVEDSTDDEF
ncbi:clusterin-associated protein 1 [Selaginella moellendorffii]|uniref:clusterin-associated protein 1 n=1 Tax=Selaginella moellendorffii TaxID=88036 RepID=UPI000D1C3F6F|nr:clusterin-associated protein 1 [Selaginella moellendorffii]|eukprot:XP_024533171.1 clusterin-associated protein 1 [Selaginella moellendorffii]